MTRTVISGAINGNWVARDEIISSLNKNSIGKIIVANEQKTSTNHISDYL